MDAFIGLILEIFGWVSQTIFERYPNLSKKVYGSFYIASLIYCWLFDDMNWLGLLLFPVFIALIFGTLFIILFYLAVKMYYRKR